ncbi:MAG: S1C family serine protease [Patescibacteria group bacterium]
MKKISSQIIIIIALPIVFGFLSGILAFSLFGNSGLNLPFLGRVNILGVDIDRQIVIDQPRSVIIEQDLQIRQMEDNILPALVSLYPVRNVNNPLNQAYLPSEIMGQGFILTADGWLITTKSAIPSLTAEYSAVGYQNKEYQAGGFIEDKTTGIVFGKMAGASGLTVAKIGASKNLSVGQTVLVASKRDELSLAHIKRIGYEVKVRQDLIQSSDKLNKEFFLDIDLGGLENGAVVANLKGEIVGIVDGGRVVMADYFSGLINQVLSNQKISRPVLGINYIDLAHTDGLFGRGEKGALVLGAPPKGAPAFGLIKDGEVIKKVNDVELSYFTSLSEATSGFKPGDKVDLLIFRAGKDEEVQVTLK